LGSILANSVANESGGQGGGGSELDEFNSRDFGLHAVYNAEFLYEEIESQIDIDFDEFKFDPLPVLDSYSSGAASGDDDQEFDAFFG